MAIICREYGYTPDQYRRLKMPEQQACLKWLEEKYPTDKE